MSREQVKEEFLKSYNCSFMKEFKHTITSEKFYEIMKNYFTKCSYNQKYKEVIDKISKIIYEIDESIKTTGGYPSNYIDDLLSILKEVE